MAHQFFFNSYILDNLPTPSAGFDVVQDLGEPRLRMYITSRGVKTFFVRKRVNGRDKRILIGKYPDMDIDDARALVPSVLTQATVRVPVRRKQITFKQLIDMYVQNKLRRSEDSQVKLVRAINRHLNKLFDKNVNDITTNDIVDVVTEIGGDAIAVRMHELLQSVFKYGIETGYAQKNVADDVPRRAQHRRVRPVDKSVIVRLISVVSEMDDVVLRAAFLMMIYGFAPKSEILAMQWSELDFNQDVWHGRPLSDAAVVLLRDLPQNGWWVFTGRGGMHLMDPRTAWRRIAQRVGVPNLTIDDVHKYMMRNLVWAADREELRQNMNQLINSMYPTPEA